VRLHDTEDHVNPLSSKAVGLLEHLVRLADASGETEVDLEPATLLLADQGQEMFWRRTQDVAGHASFSGNVQFAIFNSS
jgi:hypothetical protein